MIGFARPAMLPAHEAGCNETGWYPATDEQGRECVRPCPGCQSRRLVTQFGEDVCTWDSWVARPELEAAVAQLRAWRGGHEWACLLHAAEGKDSTRPEGQKNRGSGKSHAMQATAHEWAQRGQTVRYVAVPDLLEQHREAIGDESIRVPALAEFPGLLLLDDLGVGKTTAWVQEILERMGDYRRRHLLPTLISTNKDLPRIENEFPAPDRPLLRGRGDRVAGDELAAEVSGSPKPDALLTTVAEVLGVVPPKVPPHPRDVLDRFRGALVELEIEVSRWEMSAGAANDDPAEEVQRAAIIAIRRLVVVGLAVGAYRPKHQFSGEYR